MSDEAVVIDVGRQPDTYADCGRGRYRELCSSDERDLVHHCWFGAGACDVDARMKRLVLVLLLGWSCAAFGTVFRINGTTVPSYTCVWYCNVCYSLSPAWNGDASGGNGFSSAVTSGLCADTDSACVSIYYNNVGTGQCGYERFGYASSVWVFRVGGGYVPNIDCFHLDGYNDYGSGCSPSPTPTATATASGTATATPTPEADYGDVVFAMHQTNEILFIIVGAVVVSVVWMRI